MSAPTALGADLAGLGDLARQLEQARETTSRVRAGLAQAVRDYPVQGQYGDRLRSYLDSGALTGLNNAVVTLERLERTLVQHAEAQRNLSTNGQTGACQAAPDRPRTLNDVSIDNERGGTRSIFTQFVTPAMRDEGLAAGSQLRNYDTVAGPGRSDHWVNTPNSYATDYPTTDGLAAARRLAGSMGIENWQPNQYRSHHVTVDGQRFRVQILWGQDIDHGDHVHVGIRRVD